MKKFVINENDKNQRLDKFVFKVTRGLPTSLMYKYIRKKRIKVNSRKASEKMKLELNDVVEMYIPDEFFSTGVGAAEYANNKAKLDVVWEDENLLIANKKPGALVHTGDSGDDSPSDESERSTLIFDIKSYLLQKGEYDPERENSFVPSLCNRIDRNTGGLVIAAKNAATLRAVNEAIKNRDIHKFYLCAVHGVPRRREATLTAYLKKDSSSKTVRISDAFEKGMKKIITKYKVLSVNEKLDVSLVEVALITGRTHQIRAHMAHIGHPLVGDGKYGVNREDRKRGYVHQALYSYKLIFDSDIESISYLKGKEIAVNKKNIFFLKMFE